METRGQFYYHLKEKESQVRQAVNLSSCPEEEDGKPAQWSATWWTSSHGEGRGALRKPSYSNCWDLAKGQKFWEENT